MNKNLPKAKGFRTALQALGGFIVGLAVVVWAVPGVPDAVTQYLLENWLGVISSLGLSTGIFSGLLSLVQNKLEDK